MPWSWIAIALAVGAPSHGLAQVPVQVISGDPSCAQCVIERIPIATITDSLLPGALKRFAAVMAATDGRFVLIDLADVHVADRAGRIHRQIGRSGSGPGEFTMPNGAFENGSGFVIVDRRLLRTTTLSKDSLKVLSINRMPARNFSYLAGFADGRYALNAAVYTPDAVGHPIHIVSSDGRVLRSFGGSSNFRAGEEASLHRLVSVARDSGLWVTHPSTYRIEKWDSAGRLEAVYQRDAEWFSPYDPSVPPGPASPRVRRVMQDDRGLLWVLVTIAPPQHEAVVEVLDLATRRVVMSARFEGLTSTPAAGGFLFSHTTTSETGEPVVHVWGFRLRQ